MKSSGVAQDPLIVFYVVRDDQHCLIHVYGVAGASLLQSDTPQLQCISTLGYNRVICTLHNV